MTESEATPQRFERLFDAEYTHLTLRPATGVEPKDVHLDIELTLGGDVSEAEVDRLIADLNPDYWWSDRTRKNSQWGGQSSVTTVVVQFAAWALDGAFWALFGAALDRLISRRNSAGPTPDYERAEHLARQRIVGRYQENPESLTLVAEKQDDTERLQRFEYATPLYIYEVDVRSTPRGFPFATSIGRHSRYPNAVG